MKVRVMAVALTAGALAIGGCGSSSGNKTGSTSTGTSTANVQLTGEPASMKAVCVRLNDALARATSASNTLESHTSDQHAMTELSSATQDVLAAWITLKQHATTAEARAAAVTGESYARAQKKAAAQVVAGSGTAQGTFLDELQDMTPSITAICG